MYDDVWEEDAADSDLVEDNAANDNGDDDDFSNLRKLISEGRISGLNERPPSFVPPTPPSAGSSGDRSGGRRAKQPAPKQPQSASRSQSMTPTTSSGGSRVEKQPSRQVTEASYHSFASPMNVKPQPKVLKPFM